MSRYQEELQTAIEAARTAAELINSYKSSEDLEIRFKAKNDLVTDADLASEKKILSIIRKRYPGDQVLAEETAQKQELPGGRVWIVDPIDGTTNFAHGFPIYCVSIGLWEDGEPAVGVVLEVNGDELFTAERGEGAFLNNRRINVSSEEKYQQALLATGFPYRDQSMMAEYLQLFRLFLEECQAIRRPGSAAYDMCCVAAGRFDGFYEYALNPWDVAAASLIIREAGGMVSDWTGGDGWLFGKRIICGNPALHRYLLNRIGDVFSEEQRANHQPAV